MPMLAPRRVPPCLIISVAVSKTFMKLMGPEETPLVECTRSFFGRIRENEKPVPPPDLWISAVFSGLILAVGFVASLFLVSWMNLPPEIDVEALGAAFRWSALGSALMVLSYTVIAANMGLQSSLGIGLIFMLISIVRLVLVVILVPHGFGLSGIALPTAVMGVRGTEFLVEVDAPKVN